MKKKKIVVIVLIIMAVVGAIVTAIAIDNGNILESENNQSQQDDNDSKGDRINEGINIIEGYSDRFDDLLNDPDSVKDDFQNIYHEFKCDEILNNILSECANEEKDE